MRGNQGRRRAIVGTTALAAGSALSLAAGERKAAQPGPPEFVGALLATEPHPSLGAEADTFGRLIGSWSGRYTDRHEDGGQETGRMEVHFAWALQGRAVQDLWIAPPLSERAGPSDAGRRDMYGSTLRLFDAASGTWRAVWINASRGVRNDLVGRRVGDDIVQIGWSGDRAIKWQFTHITQDSFDWDGFVLEADGQTWRKHTSFHLERTR